MKKNKNCLFLTQYFVPENTAASIRALNILNELKKTNEVTIFTAHPNYPFGKIFENYSNKLIEIDNFRDNKIVRSKIYAKKSSNFILRFFVYLSFFCFGLVNIIFNKRKIGKTFDTIYASSGPFFTGILGYIFSIFYRCDFNIEFRDLVFVLFEEGQFKHKILKKIELFLCKKAKNIIVTTNSFKLILEENNIDTSKIKVITNAINCSGLIEINNTEVNKNDSVLKLLYMGNIGVAQDILTLIKKIDNSMENIEISIVGEGAKKVELQRYIEENNMVNVKLKNAIEYSNRVKEYKKADYVIVKLDDVENYKYFIPSKLFDAMGNGLGIIYIGPRGETSKIIEDANCGYCFNNTMEFKNIINTDEKYNEILEMKYQKGINGYTYLKDNLLRDYENTFRNL